ncbi:MAG: AsnC family transcriptional regulator [Candidatus Bathyarchaeota archaeon]|nr:AsnC family transcriptional regulator [Candidatus Bathyarchaeota archaeon]MDH5595884.1 AsnC family transcriptional regulator [Candidatus Bathyarchaeota archaeon]
MDEIDRKIISQLQLDGRTTLEELGKIVGYTSMGAKKRLKKLLGQNVIRVSALVNLESLKLCAAILFLEIETAEVMHRILERFRNCPRVIHMFTTLGGYNLIALVVAEDQDTLESISIEKCSIRSNKGIRRSEFYPIGAVHYSPFLSVREHLTHKERTISPCNVDCGPCQRYKSKKCVGCPTTHYYHGSL